MRRTAEGTRRAAIGLAGLAIVLSLSGCVPEEEPAPTTLPAPSATPVFATEEEALAAAKEAYANYLKVSDAILADGGADPERLLDVATPEVLDQEMVGFQQIATDGFRAVGNSRFDKTTLQTLEFDQSGAPKITVYLCSDVSDIDIVDEKGQSVIEGESDTRTPFQISFEAIDGSLVVSESVLWTGEDFC